jgi:hypothetical protein
MTIGQIILLSMVPLGALSMAVFTHFLGKWMPPSRAAFAPNAATGSGSVSDRHPD